MQCVERMRISIIPLTVLLLPYSKQYLRDIIMSRIVRYLAGAICGNINFKACDALACSAVPNQDMSAVSRPTINGSRRSQLSADAQVWHRLSLRRHDNVSVGNLVLTSGNCSERGQGVFALLPIILYLNLDSLEFIPLFGT